MVFNNLHSTLSVLSDYSTSKKQINIKIQMVNDGKTSALCFIVKMKEE